MEVISVFSWAVLISSGAVVAAQIAKGDEIWEDVQNFVAYFF